MLDLNAVLTPPTWPQSLDTAAVLALIVTFMLWRGWQWYRLPKEERARLDADLKENDDGWGV